MAASYSTGAATGPTDLLQKLVTWLVTQGWTQDSSVSYGSGWRAHLHKGGQYVNLRAFVNEAANATTGWGSGGALGTSGYGIAMYLGDGYNGANAWNAQSGGPLDSTATAYVGVGLYLNSGAIPIYHFLDDGADNVTVLVDRGNGLTGFLGWGPSLVKNGYTSDSWYFYGSSPGYQTCATGSFNPYLGVDAPAYAPMSMSYYEASQKAATGFVRVDASVFSSRWLGLTDTTASPRQYGYTGRLAESWLSGVNLESAAGSHPSITTLASRAYNSAFAGALLLPIWVFMLALSTRWVALGYPPTVFWFAGVGHGFGNNQVVSIGGTDYLVYQNIAVKKLA